MAYIKKLNGYVIRDEVAYEMASAAKSIADAANIKANTNATSITNIINGATTVANASNDASGNNIITTYATKGELTNEIKALKGEGLDEAYDTFREIQDYIEVHGKEAVNMATNITSNTNAIADIKETFAKIVYVTSLPSILSENTIYIVNNEVRSIGPITFSTFTSNENGSYISKQVIGLPAGIDLDRVKFESNSANYTGHYNISLTNNTYYISVNGSTADNIVGTVSYSTTDNDLYVIYKNGTKYYIPIANVNGVAMRALADKNGDDITTTYATKEEANAANVPLRAYYNTTDSELIFYIKERTDVGNNTTEVTS